jgi:hypothetical protein
VPRPGRLPRETGSHLTRRWRELDSNFRYRGTKAVDLRSIPGMTGASAGFNKYHLMVQPFFFCASNHSIEPEPATARFGEVDKAVLDDPRSSCSCASSSVVRLVAP